MLKPWKRKEDDKGLEIRGTEATKDEMQRIFKQYFKQISKALETMPKEMALIFKTRDQLQALDLRLGLGKRSQDRLISLFCLKALENDELERAPSAWKKARITTNYKVRRFVIRLKFW